MFQIDFSNSSSTRTGKQRTAWNEEKSLRKLGNRVLLFQDIVIAYDILSSVLPAWLIRQFTLSEIAQPGWESTSIVNPAVKNPLWGVKFNILSVELLNTQEWIRKCLMWVIEASIILQFNGASITVWQLPLSFLHFLSFTCFLWASRLE